MKPKGNGIAVRVKRIDDLGRARIARVELAGRAIAATIEDGIAIDGNEASLVIDPGRVHIYVDGRLVAGSPLGEPVPALGARGALP